MATTLESLTLWGGVMGPNPSKVSYILNELGLPWEPRYIEFTEVKGPEYTAINANGRLPTLVDPNFEPPITIWESGAIIDYLIERYDSQYNISFPPGTKEYYECKQYLHFQMSGQGPYYGQAWFFAFTAEEKIPMAMERYKKEIKRVCKVLDTILEGKKYLVGEKCTYADIAFLPWQQYIPHILGEEYNPRVETPNVDAWMERLLARPEVMEIEVEKKTRMAEYIKKKEAEKDGKGLS